MTTRYQDKHYEDVAEILQRYTQERRGLSRLLMAPEISAFLATARAITLDFADLFATDNPSNCLYCEGRHDAAHYTPPHVRGRSGFDRDRFLAACGLESEG